MYEMNNPTPIKISYEQLLERIINNPNLAYHIKDPVVLRELIDRMAYDYNESDGKGFWNTISGGGNFVGGITGKLTTDAQVRKVMDVLRQSYTKLTASLQPQAATPQNNNTQSIPSAQQGTVIAQPTAPQEVKASPADSSNMPTPTQLPEVTIYGKSSARPTALRPSSTTAPSTTAGSPPLTGTPSNTPSRVIEFKPATRNTSSLFPPQVTNYRRHPSSIPGTPEYEASKKNLEARTIPPKENKLGSIFNKVNQYLPTIGDALAAYGTYKGMNEAQRYTLENRATDTPNINPYAEYGARALAENDNAYSYLQRMRAYNKNELQRQAINSASQISNNTLSNSVRQSLLAANYANTLKGINDMNNNINIQELSLRDKRSALLQDIDRMVMQGEAARDLADRQDKDAYYTNLSRNATDYATGLQHLGGMLNRHKENITNSNLLAQLSQYGFALDPKTGKLFKKD